MNAPGALLFSERGRAATVFLFSERPAGYCLVNATLLISERPAGYCLVNAVLLFSERCATV